MNSNKSVAVFSRNAEWMTGAVLFAAFVGAHIFLSASAAVRVLGVGCIITGATWLIGREVPVGVESRAPSFFVTGLSAMLMGAAMIVLGALVVFYSSQLACIFGWGDGKACL